MLTKTIATEVTLKRLDASGAFTALFSTEDEDAENDVVLSSAFTPGEEVPVLWSHQIDKVIGKGRVRRVSRGAALDGRFFTETYEGLDKFKLVKAMGPTQKWSFAFRALDYDRRRGGGRLVRKLQLYEVSPVGVPANSFTGTVSIAEKRRPPRERPPHVPEDIWLLAELHRVNRELEQAKLAKALADLRRTSARVGGAYR